MSRTDDLLNKLTKKDAAKPPLDTTYEQKGDVISQISDWREESAQNDSNVLPTNVSSNKPFNETTLEENNQDTKAVRKRVSFDIRVDLHKQLKMQALLQEKNIYSLIEEAIERYLREQ